MMRLAIAALFVLVSALPLRAEINITEVTSPGGLTAWLVQEPSIPFTALEIRFRGGANLDPPDKAGAVALMANLISEGAGDLDTRAFAETRETLAMGISANAGRDHVSVSARFLTENRGEAVELMRLALNEPRFDQEALERVRRQMLSSARSALRNPNVLASREFDRRAFGKDHPYGWPVSGTEDSLAGLTRDDVVAAHRAALSREAAFIGMAGDITPEEAGPLLDQLLGDLPQTGTTTPPIAPFLLGSGVTVIPFDGPQSVITFGHEGIGRDDPDFFAAFVMNEVFGGRRFGTRLMRELRETRGLTYGVGTYLAPMDLASTIQGSMSTDNSHAATAVDIVRDQWQRMASEGVTAEELEATRTYLVGSYPLRFDGNASIAEILAALQFQDYPIDHVNTRNDRIEAVTLEQVRAVADRVLSPDGLHFVVVGRPEGLGAE